MNNKKKLVQIFSEFLQADTDSITGLFEILKTLLQSFFSLTLQAPLTVLMVIAFLKRIFSYWI